MISGDLSCVASACQGVLLEVYRESESYQSKEKDADGDEVIHVTLLMPENACGQVIGKVLFVRPPDPAFFRRRRWGWFVGGLDSSLGSRALGPGVQDFGAGYIARYLGVLV